MNTRAKEERCDQCWCVIGEGNLVERNKESYCSDGCADEAEDSLRSVQADEREGGR